MEETEEKIDRSGGRMKMKSLDGQEREVRR